MGTDPGRGPRNGSDQLVIRVPTARHVVSGPILPQGRTHSAGPAASGADFAAKLLASPSAAVRSVRILSSSFGMVFPARFIRIGSIQRCPMGGPGSPTPLGAMVETISRSEGVEWRLLAWRGRGALATMELSPILSSCTIPKRRLRDRVRHHLAEPPPLEAQQPRGAWGFSGPRGNLTAFCVGRRESRAAARRPISGTGTVTVRWGLGPSRRCRY